MSSNSNKWMKFFTDAGLPSSAATNYAITFTSHRIQNDMLTDLTKEILYDMGIKTMGDVIAILRHAKNVHHETTAERMLGTSVNEVSTSHSKGVPHSRQTRLAATAANTAANTTETTHHIDANTQSSKMVSLKRTVTGNAVAIAPKIRRVITTADVSYGNDDRQQLYDSDEKSGDIGIESLNLSKKSVFARLGVDSKPKETISSIFARLGSNTTDTSNGFEVANSINDNRITTSRQTVITRPAVKRTLANTSITRKVILPANSSGLRSLQTETSMSVKNRLGASNSSNMIATTNRLVIKRNATSTRSMTRTNAISPAVAQAKKIALRRATTAPTNKTISLKKNIFDRLGPISL